MGGQGLSRSSAERTSTIKQFLRSLKNAVKKRIYSETSLSQTRWDCIKTLNYLGILDIECKILKNKWWGLTNHFDLSIVLKISVFEITKFNCILNSQTRKLKIKTSKAYTFTACVKRNGLRVKQIISGLCNCFIQ